MKCVHARLVRHLMQVNKSGMVECIQGLCSTLIVDLFVNVRLHHLLRGTIKDFAASKFHRYRKTIKFNHYYLAKCIFICQLLSLVKFVQ